MLVESSYPPIITYLNQVTLYPCPRITFENTPALIAPQGPRCMKEMLSLWTFKTKTMSIFRDRAEPTVPGSHSRILIKDHDIDSATMEHLMRMFKTVEDICFINCKLALLPEGISYADS